MIDRETIIQHILSMMKFDIDYARAALKFYNELLPWLKLNSAVGAALAKGEAA